TRAVLALSRLGATAEPAVPALIELLDRERATSPLSMTPYWSSAKPIWTITNGPGVRMTWAMSSFEPELFSALAMIGGTNKDLIQALLKSARAWQHFPRTSIEPWFGKENLRPAAEQSIELLRGALKVPEPAVRQFSVS